MDAIGDELLCVILHCVPDELLGKNTEGRFYAAMSSISAMGGDEQSPLQILGIIRNPQTFIQDYEPVIVFFRTLRSLRDRFSLCAEKLCSVRPDEIFGKRRRNDVMLQDSVTDAFDSSFVTTVPSEPACHDIWHHVQLAIDVFNFVVEL